MPCPECNRPEKKWCTEWGLPSKDAVLCWVTSQPLKIGELINSNIENKNLTEKT